MAETVVANEGLSESLIAMFTSQSEYCLTLVSKMKFNRY